MMKRKGKISIGMICTLLTVLSISPQLVQAATLMEVPVPAGLKPWKLAVDSSNNIWFGANGPLGEGYIVKYDTTLETFTNYSLPTGVAAGAILGAAIDSNGNVWVAESSANKIAWYNASTGTVQEFSIATPEEPNPIPVSIAVDSSNNIWIGCESYGKIVKFTPSDGTFEDYYFPATYSGSVAHDIKVRGDTAWFTDSTNPYLGSLNISSGSFDFRGPLSSYTVFLDFDSKNNVWFSECNPRRGVHNIAVYNTTDQMVTEYPVPSPGDDSPYGVAVDINDKVWLAERSEYKIGMFDPVTKSFTEYGTTSMPYDVVKDLIDNIWYIGGGSWRIGRLDPTGYKRIWESGLEARVSCTSPVAVGEEFTLKVMVKNVASGPISDASITLDLREGMILRSEETAIVPIGALDAGQWTMIEWHLTVTRQGNYLNKVHASGLLEGGSTVWVRVFWMTEAGS